MARFAIQRSPFKAPFLALSILSILLSLAITGCAAHVLQVFTSQQQTNAWWLPIWPSHFDTRGLKTLIGTSVPIFVLNGIAVVVGSLAQPWTTYVSLACTSLTTILALFALIFPAIVNNAAPGRDSMQTWTCRWSSMEIERGQSAPNNFGPMCHESVSFLCLNYNSENRGIDIKLTALRLLHHNPRVCDSTVAAGVRGAGPTS